MTTEIASAVDSVPLGVFRLVRPSLVWPSRSSRKIVTTRRISSDAGGTAGRARAVAELADATGDDGHLLVGGRRQGQHDRVEAPPQGARHLVDAAIAVVGGGDEVEAGDRRHLGVELGDRQHLLRQDRDEGVLDLRRHAGDLLDAHDASVLHRPVHRARDQRRLARAVLQQAGVVPAVAQRLLGRAGGALDEQGRVAADGRGEVLADPRLGRARHAEQEQAAVGGERRHRHLDEATRSDVLGGDDASVDEGAPRSGR